jgi:SAM-dependent methyltransferase
LGKGASAVKSTQVEKEECHLEPWVLELLADPISKSTKAMHEFKVVNGVLDARVYLRNTHGFSEWKTGQSAYEAYEVGSANYNNAVSAYKAEIDYDRPTYEHFRMDGTLLDVGGGVGIVREFLPPTVRFVSIDPYVSCVHEIPAAKKTAYSCLSKELNFIAAMAEFLPFLSSQFDWVHMRSMLDHVQVPDLALLEARRVLKDGGGILVGLTVWGGRSGRQTVMQKSKELLKGGLSHIGIDRWTDHHVWHPTFAALTKLIEDNGFTVRDVYWQPHWKDQVCYVFAQKT